MFMQTAIFIYINYNPALTQAILKLNPEKRKREDFLSLLMAKESNFGLNKLEILNDNIGYLEL